MSGTSATQSPMLESRDNASAIFESLSTGQNKAVEVTKQEFKILAPVMTNSTNPEDPFDIARLKRPSLSTKELKRDHPGGKARSLKKYYTRQNDLIDSYLGSAKEEEADDLDMG